MLDERNPSAAGRTMPAAGYGHVEPASLPALDQLKSRFLANISHEMRTPLNGIIGSVKLLQMMNEGEEQAELLDNIRLSARRMMHLVENALLHAELEAGRLERQTERIMPERLLRDFVEDFSDDRKPAGVALLVDLDRTVPDSLVTDKENFIRIMNQLLDNALKHTRRGSVTLAAAMTSIQLPDMPAWANDVLAVSVKDTGVGVDPEVLETLFSSFALADDSFTRRFQGAGLGLSLCGKLAAFMGARIEVESTPGQGSTFRLLLPVQKAAHAAADGISAKSLPVLVVEDDETSRILMGLFCELVGLEVVLSASGSAGWEWYNQSAFRLVLMDIQMPGMSGLEVLSRIRAREMETGAHVCVLAVTAYATPEDRNRFLSAGFDDILEKPVDLNRFRGMLEKWKVR